MAICALVLWFFFRCFFSRLASFTLLLLLCTPLFVPFSVDAESANTIELDNRQSVDVTKTAESLNDTGLSIPDIEQRAVNIELELAAHTGAGASEMRMAPAWVVAVFEYFQANIEEAYVALKSILLVQCVLVALLLFIALLRHRFFPAGDHRFSSNR